MHVHVAWKIDVWVFVKKPGSRITCQGLRLKCQGFKNVGILFIVIYLLHALLLIFEYSTDISYKIYFSVLVNCGLKREENLWYLGLESLFHADHNCQTCQMHIYKSDQWQYSSHVIISHCFLKQGRPGGIVWMPFFFENVCAKENPRKTPMKSIKITLYDYCRLVESSAEKDNITPW